MPHFLVTYDLNDTAKRADFVAQVEQALIDLGLQKQDTNQSTYFGHYPGSAVSFSEKLGKALEDARWHKEDQLTIYHPKVTKNNLGKNIADIGVHQLKKKR